MKCFVNKPLMVNNNLQITEKLEMEIKDLKLFRIYQIYTIYIQYIECLCEQLMRRKEADVDSCQRELVSISPLL